MGFDCLDLLSVLLLGSSCTRVVGIGLMSLGLYLCLCAEYLGVVSLWVLNGIACWLFGFCVNGVGYLCCLC